MHGLRTALGRVGHASRWVAAFLVLWACARADEKGQGDKKALPAPAERTRWTTSRVVGSPEPAAPYRHERAFAGLKFDEPLYLSSEPGSDRLFVVQRQGKILTFVDKPTAQTASELHDMKRQTYSVTFHPRYRQNGFLYVFSNGAKEQPGSGKKDQPAPGLYNRISRFKVATERPNGIVPGSETVVIEWKSGGHDGGDLGFGLDGFLYIVAGDGTGDSDTDNTGQDIRDLPGGVLRIDVDHAADGLQYRIPDDNPFVQVPKARGEIWAFGLRNPWRMSFDEKTGQLWVGNVGQDLWEMIYLVRRGDNFGWSVYEGSHPFYPQRSLGPAALALPVVEHHHTEARSITGGYVYHGSRLKELQGHYIYCDYETGTVWGFRYEGGKAIDHKVLAHSGYKVASFGRDRQGELYLVALSGEIYRLIRNERAGKTVAGFPRRLSETGVFESVKEGRPAPGVIPYCVNAPAWHDGATAERYLGVPGDGKITWSDARGWTFEDGAVAVQTLSLELQPGDPRSRRRIETRLLTRQDGEWQGYSYRWNAEQTEAELVGREGVDVRLAQGRATSAGEPQARVWHIPGRTECMACHSRAANWVLGLSALQMNRAGDGAGQGENQIRALQRLRLFAELRTKPADGAKGPTDPHQVRPEDLPRLVDPYEGTAELAARARSYLHANCAHCHVAAGGGNAQMDLEFATEAEKTKMFDVPPVQATFGIDNARLIAARDPWRSVIVYRMAKLGRGRMPHLGSAEVDTRAVVMMHDWIRGVGERGEKRSDAKSLATPRREQERMEAELRLLDGTPGTQPKLAGLLSTSTGSLALLVAILKDQLSEPARKQAVARGSVHPDGNVRDLFEQFLPPGERLKRLGTSFEPASVLSLKGNAASGEQLLFHTDGIQCKSCHRANGKGDELGPDLSEIGKKYTPAQLLESIVDPSKQVEEKYRTYQVATKDGLAYSGLLVSRTAAEVVLSDSQRKVIRLAAGDVELIAPQRQSLMPEQLLRDLTAQQAADLIAYLSALRGQDAGRPAAPAAVRAADPGRSRRSAQSPARDER